MSFDIERGDCLELMKDIPDKSIDMILCDPPYGTVACSWDLIIPFDKLWEQYNRIVRNDGAIVLTSAQPFTTVLAASNLKNFRYSLVWDKKFAGNFVQAKRMPMRTHEDILVFCNSGKSPRYFPIMEKRDVPIKSGGNKQSKAIPICVSEASKKFGSEVRVYDEKYPISILEFTNRGTGDRGFHPTQKPVALMEYLIKTYSNIGDTILDNCMGSGTTGVACMNLGRKFIGMEQDEKYFEISKTRIEEAKFKFDNQLTFD